MSTAIISRVLRRPARPLRSLIQPRTTLRSASDTSSSAPSTTQKATDAAASAASSAQNAASSAQGAVQSTAQSLQTRAAAGLSRAGPAVSNAAQGLSNTVARMGGRTGRLLRLVESAIPPTVYYSRVGLEFSKLVFEAQKMAPPSLQTFQTAFEPLVHAVRHPRTLLSSISRVLAQLGPQGLLGRLRDLSRIQLATGAVIAAEILGFFSVGEMLGRWKIVGYRGAVQHDH